MRACDAHSLLARALDAHPLPPGVTLNVVAAGKAAQPMLDAFMTKYGARARGVVVARGGHPLPNAESFAAGEAALRVADANQARRELMVVLLSGGASAMMDAPAGGATLDDAIALNRDLLQSGLPIAEMNARRTQLSAIKGGQLALRAGRSITYAISDVHAPVEDDPAVIGSGPTFLREPVAGIDAQFVLAGSRRDAMAGASEEAARLGYDVQLVGPPTLGEARDAADRLVASLGASGAATVPGLSERRSRPQVRMSVIASGETTVRLPLGSKGRGGRNQEFALAAALAMTHWESDWALASIGTDGIDGPTNAAGAIVDRTTLARANDQRLDARGTLQAHNTYDFFERLGDLVLTGPTGTNVGDLQVLVTEGLGALG